MELSALDQPKQTDEEKERHRIQNMTVPEYVQSHIEGLESTKSIERSTAARYRAALKGQIAPYFEKIRLYKLSPDDIRKWLSSLLEKGLSNATAVKAYVLLKSSLARAVEREILEKNPADRVKPPKLIPKKPGINALDVRERRRLLTTLDGLENMPVTIAARIALFTGMREGEVCGLRWVDVDLEARKIWVRQAIGRGKDGETYVKTSKSDRVRDIPIPESLVNILAEWKRTRDNCDPSSYVIGSRKYASPTTICKKWSTLAHAFNFTGIEGRTCTFHDLRHTYATMAVAAHMDIKTLSSILGHTSASMTLDIYASVDPDAKRQAGDIIERAVCG